MNLLENNYCCFTAEFTSTVWCWWRRRQWWEVDDDTDAADAVFADNTTNNTMKYENLWFKTEHKIPKQLLNSVGQYIQCIICCVAVHCNLLFL